jgi:hypothetical protein
MIALAAVLGSLLSLLQYSCILDGMESNVEFIVKITY